jgi:hypothetical protein
MAIGEWLGTQIKPIGIGFICLGVIELACIFAACHVMLNGGGDDDGTKAQKKKEAEMKKQQGNELAFGGQLCRP